MKRLILAISLLTSSLFAQATGDLIIQKVTLTGATEVYVTPVATRLLGLDDTSNPTTITLGSGLTLPSNVLTLDSDLSSIAPLTTTSYGRGLLEVASAAALRSSLSLTTAATTNISGGGNLSDDFGKIPVYNVDGNLVASLAFELTDGTASASYGLGSIVWNDGTNTGTLSLPTLASQVWDLPAVGGIIIASGDTGTVTNTMLANSVITINGSAIALGGSISGLQTTAGTLALGGFSGITGTVPVANGGTGSTTAAGARVNLLPSFSGQGGKALRVNAGETDIEYFSAAGSGTVTSIAVSGTDGIDVDSGSPITAAGTIQLGVNAATLKTHLSLGNVENTALSTWAGTTNITTLGTIGTGTWQGAAIGDSYISGAATWNAKQAGDATLTALAGTGAANTFPYFTALDTAASASITTAGLAILDDADNTAQRATLGLVIGTNVQAYDADLDDLADGSLSGSKVGTGIDAANITTGTLPAARIGTGDIGATQIAATAVTPGSYTAADITVDADGRITAASNGSGGGGGGATITAHSVASDQTSSSTSYADVTGLTASVAANTTYVFEAYIIWQSSGSTEGIGLAVNGPASPTLLVSHAAANASANYYQFITVATAYDTGALATSGAGATDRAAHVRGVITTGASSGTFAIRYRAETGGANSATVKTGSTLIMTELP